MFQHLGFFREYYVNGKFIGCVNCEKDRELIGHAGRQTNILEEEVKLEGKKKIKQGTTVMTMLYPLCGKLIRK